MTKEKTTRSGVGRRTTRKAKRRYVPNMKLVAAQAKKYGIKPQDIRKSDRKDKKLMVRYKGRWIHFGNSNYSDYTVHRDPERRRLYRARHRGVMTKEGKPAYLDKTRPAYYAYHILW